MKRVSLYGRSGCVGCALVDDADFRLVGGHRWNVSRYGYAVSKVDGVLVSMHRLILGLKSLDGKKTDHIDGNKLNNLRVNLRICTQAQNTQNRTKAWGSSKYRGVYWNASAGRWQAYATINYKPHYLGVFLLEEEAAKAASEFRKKHMTHSVENYP